MWYWELPPKTVSDSPKAVNPNNVTAFGKSTGLKAVNSASSPKMVTDQDMTAFGDSLREEFEV